MAKIGKQIHYLCVPAIPRLNVLSRNIKRSHGITTRGVDFNMTKARELHAILHNEHVLALVVLRSLDITLVRMTIESQVDSMRISNHYVAAPARSNAPLPQMSQQHHVVSIARCARIVHCGLYCVVECSTRFVFATAANQIAIGIPNACQAALGHSLGRKHAHIGNAHRLAAYLIFLYNIGVKQLLTA